MSAKVKVALVGPNFFSYVQSIRDEFLRRGIESDYFDERHSNSIPVKIIYRLGLRFLIASQKLRYFEVLIDKLVRGGYSDVLLVDVEVIDRTFVDRLVGRGIKVHIYMWDSARNKSGFLAFLDTLSGKSSFEPEDCRQYGMDYIPLFADDAFCSEGSEREASKYDFSFCGTLHSDRGYHVNELRKYCGLHGVGFEEWLYFHSKLLFLITCLRRPVNFLSLGKISTSGFSKAEVARLFSESKFVLDIPHAGQKGLTARTFEVLRSGGCLVTSNKNVAELPDELVSRVLVFDEIERIDFVRLSQLKGGVISSSSDYYLSIARFVDQLVETMGLDRVFLSGKQPVV